jgi:sirohydrochlorin cobaltochelatase
MADSTEALVIAGHGSHLNPHSDTPVFDHADSIRERGVFDEVREAFWKEEPSLREVLRTLESDVVYVVPLFMSEGYFTERVIPRELRLEDEPTLDVDKTVQYTEPVGTHDAMTDVIVQRAESVTDDPEVGAGSGLAIVGHGTERHENSARSTRHHAARIRERDRFDEVDVLFMDESPYVEAVTERFDSPDIVVVPLFVADGYHTREDIPEDLGLTDDYRTGYPVPANVDGHRVWYAGAVGTEPRMADVVLERAIEAGATDE